jgi:nitric oxide reductase FlRd-NAD(+) reductase
MDFCRAGKAVTVVDNSASVLSALMPPEASSRLQHRLTDMGVHLMLKSQLEAWSKPPTAFASPSTASVR